MHVRGGEGAKFEIKGVTWRAHPGRRYVASYVECDRTEPGKERSVGVWISEVCDPEMGD